MSDYIYTAPGVPVRIIVVSMDKDDPRLLRTALLRQMEVTNEFADVVAGQAIQRRPTGRQEVRLILDPVEESR